MITYSAATSAREKAKQSENVVELLEEMRQKCLEPNVITYYAAISACDNAKQSQKVLELIQERQQKTCSQM